MLPTVRAVLSPPAIARIEVHDCLGGFAHATAIPAASNYNVEQVYLHYAAGRWRVVTHGSGITCTIDQPDVLQGASVLACESDGGAALPTAKQRAALMTLHDYLEAWAERGPKAATRAYLVPAQWQSGLRLRTGQLLAYASTPPENTHVSPVVEGQFTLLVSLDLHFVGDAGAWGDGQNDLFVTFRPGSGRGHYLMEFNSGP